MSTATPLPPSAASSASDHKKKLLEGLMHQKENRAAEAEQAYQEVLAANPDNSQALCMMGLLARSQGRLDDALLYLTRAADADPTFVDAHQNKGEVLLLLGSPEQALACFEQALRISPELIGALVHKSTALQKLGRLDDALTSDQKALSVHPTSADIRTNIARVLGRMGRTKEALFQFDITLNETPGFIDALFHKGALLFAMGRLTDALAAFEEGITLNGADANLLSGKGSVCLLLERYEEALTCYQQSLALEPNDAQTHANIGVLYKAIGRNDDAVRHLRKAIAIQPDYAEAHQNLALALLLQNDITEALDAYEWRWRMQNRGDKMRDYDKPQWQGEPELLDKTLMLWPEQGPQDITIWASGLPQIIARSKRCILNTYPKLVPLFQRSFPDADVRADEPDIDKSPNDFDFHLPMGSLFKYTRPDLEPDHQQEAYLIPDPDRVTYWRKRLAETGPAPYVGISWKGALITDSRAPNYTEVADWTPLIHKPATFVNLQCGKSASELADFEIRHGVKVHDFEDLDLFDNLDDVAAFAAALDVAISVSTCVSALTAGVGTSTWILAWKQSPWNNFLLRSRGPDVTHYERDSGEDWQACFTAMADRLQTLIDA